MSRRSMAIWGLALAWTLGACGPTPAPQTQGTDPTAQQGEAADASPTVEPPAGVPGWMSLADGRTHGDMEATAPVGFHVQGRITEGGFAPEGDVLGEGVLATEGHPGWLELKDGQFYGDEAARSPAPPYVPGFQSPDGVFTPSTRTVTY